MQMKRNIVFAEVLVYNKNIYKLGFIFAFPLRGRGTALAVDEGLAISSYKWFSKLHIFQKYNKI